MITAATKKGDYIEQKWIRKRKEFLKLHIAVDAKSEKIVSFRVTKGNVHDIKKLAPMIKEVAEKYHIDKVYGDRAHDNRKSFNLLADGRIKIREIQFNDINTDLSRIC